MEHRRFGRPGFGVVERQGDLVRARSARRAPRLSSACSRLAAPKRSEEAMEVFVSLDSTVHATIRPGPRGTAWIARFGDRGLVSGLDDYRLENPPVLHPFDLPCRREPVDPRRLSTRSTSWLAGP